MVSLLLLISLEPNLGDIINLLCDPLLIIPLLLELSPADPHGHPWPELTLIQHVQGDLNTLDLGITNQPIALELAGLFILVKLDPFSSYNEKSQKIEKLKNLESKERRGDWTRVLAAYPKWGLI